MKKLLGIVVLGLLWSNVGFTEIYLCDFSSDKHREGKSNKVTCAKNPEVVFSTKYRKLEIWKHCDNEKVFDADSITDVVVDLKLKAVRWEEKIEQTEYSIKYMYNHYLESGYSEEEAKKAANFTYPPRHGFFKIYSISEGTEKIHFNKKLKKAYDPEKIIKTKTISFRDSIYDYHLYIPDIDHGQSILTEYVSNDDNSWIRMRFGHCEKLER